MTQTGKQKLWLAAASLTAVVVLSIHLGDLGGEFGGGRLTGKIDSMANVGWALFLIGLVATIFAPRAAALVALLATILSLPLYAYAVAPGPFRQLFKGNYSVPLPQSFTWNWWAVSGIATLMVTGVLSARALWSQPAIEQS